jgi:Uma2 family endonuclease
MVARASQPYIPPDVYLQRERDAEFKSEYWNGVIVAMSGGSREHEYIADNIRGALYTLMRGKPCRSFGSIPVHIPTCNRYVYPDASIACSPEFTGIDGIDVLTNPVLVVEVLSKSTAKTDLTTKKDGYATLESLSLYMVISQDEPRVELFVRQSTGTFRTEIVARGHDSIVPLAALDCQISLADIYQDVTFDEEQEPDSSA